MRAEAAPCPWFGITNTSKPASRIAPSYDVANTFAVRAIMRQDHPGFAPAARAQPCHMDCQFLPLRFVVVHDVDLLPDELANPDRHGIRAGACTAYVEIGPDLHQRIATLTEARP
jgi:hypothetical protein